MQAFGAYYRWHNALIFDNSLYKQDIIIITSFTLCYVCICATFCVEGEHDQIIVTDFGPDNPDIQFRCISATNKEVKIWGATTDSEYVPIKKKVAGRPFGLNGNILVIVEYCLISMAQKFLEYFQVKVHHQWRDLGFR